MPRKGFRATHCKKGHEFTPENTYVYPGTGLRSCRKCKSDGEKERYWKDRKVRIVEHRAWKERNPEKIRAYSRRDFLSKKNWTPEQFDRVLEEQDNKCAICSAPITIGLGNKNKNKANADHDHVTGQPRGILCNNCNIGLGNLQDSVVILKIALEYLEKYQKF